MIIDALLPARSRARLSIALVLGLAPLICAAAPANPAPTRADWTTIADQPDLSGVWSPGPLDKYGPGGAEAPHWLPQVAQQIDALKGLDAAGRPQNIYINCLPEGLPSSVTQNLNSVEFLVTPGRITILGELDGNRLRRVWTDGRPHPADPDPSFSGHSIGHWQDKALVIDTIGFLPEVFIPLSQGVGFPNNGDMHVTERITLTGPDSLRQDIVVDAPHVLAAPWHASRIYTRHRDRSFDLAESSCREGDFLESTDAHGNAVFVPVPKDAGGATLPLDQANTPSKGTHQ